MGGTPLENCNNCNTATTSPLLAASYGYVYSSSVFVAPFFKNHAKQKNSVKIREPQSPLRTFALSEKKGRADDPARTSPALMINAPGVSVIHAASSG